MVVVDATGEDLEPSFCLVFSVSLSGSILPSKRLHDLPGCDYLEDFGIFLLEVAAAGLEPVRVTFLIVLRVVAVEVPALYVLLPLRCVYTVLVITFLRSPELVRTTTSSPDNNL